MVRVMERKDLKAGSVQSRLAFELEQGPVIGLRYLLSGTYS
jgi:hypothetical protein